MNLRHVLALNAVLAAFHGVAFIGVPSLMLGLYQIPPGPGAALMGQLFGAELLVVAIVCWRGRHFDSAAALDALVLAGVVANAVGLVLCLRAIQTGSMGIMGWLGVAIYAALAGGYLWTRPRAHASVHVA